MQAEMQTLAHKSVVGVFDSQAEADAVLDQLRAQGLASDEVSVMMRDAQPMSEIEVAKPISPVAGGAATGATLGGALGLVLGWMEAIGSIQIPGIVVGTPSIPGVGTPLGDAVLAASIVGLILGAAVGGLIGALLGLTVPADRTTASEATPHEGRILVTVHPSQALDVESVARIMQNNGGYDVRVYDAPVIPAASTEEVLVAQGITDGDETSAMSLPAEAPEMSAMADASAVPAMAEMPTMAEPSVAQMTSEPTATAQMTETRETPTQPLTSEASMTAEATHAHDEAVTSSMDTAATPQAQEMPTQDSTPGTEGTPSPTDKSSGD